jgi:hypothetical protein
VEELFKRVEEEFVTSSLMIDSEWYIACMLL